MKHLFFCFLLVVFSQVSAQYFEPEVVLWNGTVIKPGTIEIVGADRKSGHLFINGEQAIALKLVDHFQINEDYYVVRKTPDQRLLPLKRVLKGHVSIFEYSEKFYDNSVATGGISTQTTTYYMYNDRIESFNIPNIKKDLSEYTETMNSIKKMRRSKYVKLALVISGFALTAVGVGQMWEKEPGGGTSFRFSANPPFVGGLVALGIPITMHMRNPQNLTGVIMEHNARQAFIPANNNSD